MQYTAYCKKSNLKKFLKSEGFDLDFNKCTANKDIEEFVLNDRIEAVKKFKVNATPTIIINNEKFSKTLNYKNLKKYIFSPVTKAQRHSHRPSPW